MKYRDLIHFDPPQKVVQLRHADDARVARELVSTYVISDRMADVLTRTVFPQLQYDNPKDNKALLVVGNYGTGKSHLLSLLSSLAERAEVLGDVRNERVRQAAGGVAGRFKVLRLEIGATTMALRDFVCDALQNWLQEQRVNFVFRPMSEVWENKKELGRMMAAFHGRYPDHGLLLVVDEMLDYLRTRNHQALPLDLGFLREVGEVCRDLRLRFIAGLQESLFESPQFQFAADSLNRVKDRFEQFRIAREDLAFVVAERLLRKTPEQKTWIRAHLSKFTHLFGAMQERLDQYVELYPVHPAYLEVFERVRIGEKRQALASLSAAMAALLDKDVPLDQPGVIAYDSYWQEIKDNAGFRADPSVGRVIKCAETIEARVVSGFTSPALVRLVDPARRLIHGLAVQRLTDGDITAPIGVTPEQLRDELAVTIPGVKDAAFLKTTVETVLKEVSKTVSGQFISMNTDNGQYYLDVHKDIDFDAQISARADTLGPDTLDRHYFKALASVMECPGETYVSGYQIWEHEVEWREHKVGRAGYLFFGAPNQRSTAQPPREFYLYFLQPFSAPRFDDEQKADEVFFRLSRDERFEQTLKLYAGASEQASTAGGYRPKYEEKANAYLRQLVVWLRENLPSKCDVTYQGTTRRLAEWSRSGSSSKGTVREMIQGVASACLAPHFQDRYPEYPTFSQLIMRESRRAAVGEALAWLAGNRRTSALGKAILDGLEMLDGDQVRVVDHREPSRGSRYATHVYNELIRKGAGQVLNRSELIASEHNGAIQYDRRFKLEPELLVVVLASLVAAENVSLAVVGKKYDAASLAELARVPVADLMDFKHLERPKDFDVAALRELFKLLSLNEGLAVTLSQGGSGDGQAAVQTLQTAVTDHTQRALKAGKLAESGLSLWGQPLLVDAERAESTSRLAELGSFLDGLLLYNSPAKFKNFRHTAPEVARHYGAVDRVRLLESIEHLVGQLAPKIGYLQTAASALPPAHPWGALYENERREILEQLRNPKRRNDPDFQRELGERLEGLKQEWRRLYMDAHARHRLSAQDDKRKAKLLQQDSRVIQLRRLTEVQHIPEAQLDALTNNLASVRSCWHLVANELSHGPLCPHCAYQPRDEATHAPARERLDSFDLQIDALLTNWTEKLLSELKDPVVQEERIPLLAAEHQATIRRFLDAAALPDPLTASFVQAVNEALADLVRVVLARAKLIETFSGPAMTAERFRAHFDLLLNELVRGQDPKKVRIVLE